MVGPFPDYKTDLHGLVYMRSEKLALVALWSTPVDAVFIARGLFESLVGAHCDGCAPICLAT